MEPVLDMQVVDELVSLTDEGDPELLLDLIQLFLDDGPVKVNLIVTGLAANDFEQMERAAHALKGSAGNLGARQVQGTCEQMQLITRKHDLAQARRLAKDLEGQFAEVQKALRDLQQRFA